MQGTVKGTSFFKAFMKFLYAISLIAIAYFLISGFSFYETGYQKRPQLENYRFLRPAGDFGHGVGIVGSAMMLFMLLYSLRKRTRFFGNAGKLNHWLDIHIYFGIIGPLLVVLHSSFKVQGLIAVSFWSMVAVALSGVLGRYLYLQIPRNVDGESLSMSEIQTASDQLVNELKNTHKITDDIIEYTDNRLRLSMSHESGLIRSIISIFFDDIKRPFKIRKLKRDVTKRYKLPGDVFAKLIDISRRKSLLERKVLLLNQLQQLFHYWHIFHKPFAIIMYLIMMVHIGVAIWLGYTWIF
jgi:hypothetical protein